MGRTEAFTELPGGGWLGMIPRAVRSEVIALSTLRHVEAGTELIREGERAATLGIVGAGRVALQLHLAGRGQVTIATVEPGGVFGVSALVPPHVATTSVTAVVPADLFMIDVETLRKRFAADCELAAGVYIAVSRALLSRLNDTHEMVLDLLEAAQARPI